MSGMISWGQYQSLMEGFTLRITPRAAINCSCTTFSHAFSRMHMLVASVFDFASLFSNHKKQNRHAEIERIFCSWTVFASSLFYN
jgi:hypothetical protein